MSVARKLAQHQSVEEAFECSGHPASISSSIDAVDILGMLVQVGMLSSSVTAPVGKIVVKEIDYRGTFRFDREFAEAANVLSNDKIDAQQIVTHQFPISAAVEAFEIASQRETGMKVQLRFDR